MVHREKKTNPYERLTINYKRSFSTNKRGLTLIELLVVISIIGILASLATFTYTESQAKSRDSRRKSDIDAIKKALELAKQDSAGAYSYPACDTYTSGRCTINDATGSSSSTDINGVVPDLIGTNYSYIKEVPKDPKTNADYIYITSPANCGTGTCNTFKLIACLENTKDPQSDVGKGGSNDSACGSGTTSFSVTNL